MKAAAAAPAPPHTNDKPAADRDISPRSSGPVPEPDDEANHEPLPCRSNWPKAKRRQDDHVHDDTPVKSPRSADTKADQQQEPSKLLKALEDLRTGKTKRPRELTEAEWVAQKEQQEKEREAALIERVKASHAKRVAEAKNNGHTPPEKATGRSAISKRQAEALQAQQYGYLKSTKPDDSTRFFLRVAKDTGSVRLAALCFYIAVCTSRKPGSCWRTTTAQLGAQIGVKAWQTKHLLKLASDAEALEKLGSPKLLTYQKTRRGVAVSVADKTLYEQLDLKELDLKTIGWYRPSLAKKYRSIDAAIAHDYLHPPEHEDEKDLDGSFEPVFVPAGGHYLTAGKLMRLCKWMKKSTAYDALNKLVEKGKAERRPANKPWSDIESVYEYHAIDQKSRSPKTTPLIPNTTR